MSAPRLIVMRHAHADKHAASGLDYDRPLSARGLGDATAMGRWLYAHGPAPTRAAVSPALRTRQTLEAVLAERPLTLPAPELLWDEALYLAEVDVLKEVVTRELTAVTLLLGHNPGLEALLCYLLGDRVVSAVAHEPVATASVFIMTLPEAGRPIGRGSATLINHMQPTLLARAEGRTRSRPPH